MKYIKYESINIPGTSVRCLSTVHTLDAKVIKTNGLSFANFNIREIIETEYSVIDEEQRLAEVLRIIYLFYSLNYYKTIHKRLISPPYMCSIAIYIIMTH